MASIKFDKVHIKFYSILLSISHLHCHDLKFAGLCKNNFIAYEKMGGGQNVERKKIRMAVMP